jgi:drug/metabolite transporter superfamily protein YnfA
MEEEINFCPRCGEDQRANNVNQQKSNASFLIALCVFTIIGSVFTIGRAYLYEMVSMMGEGSNYFRGWIYAGSAIGTLVGAIMMLQRKLKGLYVYSAFQGIYIITVLVASFSYSDTFDSFDGGNGNEASLLASGIAMFFLLPSILFLILYWTNMIKKHLT